MWAKLLKNIYSIKITIVGDDGCPEILCHRKHWFGAYEGPFDT